MTSETLYCPVESHLHWANPFTKLVLLLGAASLGAALPVVGLWLVAALFWLAAFVFGVGRPVSRRLILLFLPFALAVFLLHSFVLPRPDMQAIGPFLSFSKTGLLHATQVAGRIAVILTASLLFVASTHPSDMLRAFDAAGWPPALSYLLASPMLLLDQFRARATAIQQAQQARGLNVRGGLRARMRAISVLLVPLVTLALTDAQERAQVLTARGFRAQPRRSVLRPPPDSRGQRRLRRAVGIGAVVLVGYALWP